MSDIVTTDKPTHDEVIRVLENSLYPGAKRESIELVLAYCRANGLDPMLRPVYIVPTSIKKPDGQWETRDVLMPGIADYRIKAARSGEYGGKSEPEFGPDVEATLGDVAVTYPVWCRVTVKRLVQGHAREFVAMERWVENYATAGRNTQAPNTMWKKRPYGQLAKVAEAQALRMAFPEFSAGYTMEEMQGKTLHDEWSGTTLEAETRSPPPSLRAVAATVTRPERKVAPKTEVYANRLQSELARVLTPEQLAGVEAWIAEFQVKLDRCQTRAELDLVVTRPAVTNNLENGPDALKREINAMIAAAYDRLPAVPRETPDDLEIVGADKLAAG